MGYWDKWKEAFKEATSKIKIPDVEISEIELSEIKLSDISSSEPISIQGNTEIQEPISTDMVIQNPIIPKDIIPDISTSQLPEQLKRVIPIPKVEISDIIVQELPSPVNIIPKLTPIIKQDIYRIKIPDITEYNIFQKVKELMEWKENFANPNILGNIEDIGTIYNDLKDNVVPTIKTNVENISVMYTDLTENIAPSVNRAKDLAISAMESAETNMNNIESIFIDLRDNVVPTINKAKEVALLAAENAQKAMDYAKGFILKLQLAGEVMKYGIEDLAINANELYRVITVETKELSDSYKDFGLVIQTGASNIITELTDLASEMAEFAREVKPALSAAASNAQSATAARSKIEDDLDDLGRHIRDLKWDRAYDDLRDLKKHLNVFVRDSGDAIAYLTFRGADGHDAVLPELVEGLVEIGTEVSQLNSAVWTFTVNLYNESNKLAEQNRNSFNTIRRQVNVFSNSFLRIFTDLHIIFTREYTSQEIAEEQAIRRAERERYLEFTDSLRSYDVSVSLCEQATGDLVFAEEALQVAIDDYNTTEIYYNNSLTELAATIAAGKLVQILRPISDASPNDWISRRRPHYNVVNDEKLYGAGNPSNYVLSTYTLAGSNQLEVFNMPTIAYTSNISKIRIYYYWVTTGAYVSYSIDGGSSWSNERLMTHLKTVDNWYWGYNEWTNLTIENLDNFQIKIRRNGENITFLDLFYVEATYTSMTGIIDNPIYKELLTEKETTLTEKQLIIDAAQVKYDEIKTIKESECGAVSQYREFFMTEYGITPEQADLLTYQEIIEKI